MNNEQLTANRGLCVPHQNEKRYKWNSYLYKPAKKLTTLEIRNLRSELKDVEGSIQELVDTFKLYEARKKQIEQMLGVSE